MKNYHVGYCIVAAVLSLTSCQEDVKDERQPTLSITSPTAGQKIWLEAPLSVAAADEQGVNKVMFYIDDELVGEDTEAPFELMLDTKAYEDGAYTLRTVAYDASENQTEAVQEIEIFNKLFSVKVEDNYLNGHRFAPHEAWIITTDNEGKLIQTMEIQNGETFTVNRNGREDEKLTISLLTINDYDSNDEFVNVHTYQDISPNEWLLKGYTELDQTILGTAQVNFTVSGETQTMASSSNAAVSFFPATDGEGYEVSMDIIKEPAGLFIANNATDGSSARYASLDAIRVGDQYSLTVDDFKPMVLLQNISLGEADYAYVSVSATNEEIGSYYKLFHHSSKDNEVPSELSVYHPEEMFDEYSHYITIRQNELTYRASGRDALKSRYEVPQLSTDVVNGGNEIHVQGEFSADFGQGHREYFQQGDNGHQVLNWYVHAVMSEGRLQLKNHTLPAEILEKHSFIAEAVNYMEYKYTRVVNYTNIESFSEYMENIYRADDQSPLRGREEVSIRASGASNGRSIQDLLPEEMRMKLEEYRLR